MKLFSIVCNLNEKWKWTRIIFFWHEHTSYHRKPDPGPKRFVVSSFAKQPVKNDFFVTNIMILLKTGSSICRIADIECRVIKYVRKVFTREK